MTSSAPAKLHRGRLESKKIVGAHSKCYEAQGQLHPVLRNDWNSAAERKIAGQKYRLHDLQEDTAALKEEQEALAERTRNIKRDLLHEASFEPTGLFASRPGLLFGERE